jgi:hypothetical protein
VFKDVAEEDLPGGSFFWFCVMWRVVFTAKAFPLHLWQGNQNILLKGLDLMFISLKDHL